MESQAGTLLVGDSESPRVSLSLSQPVFSPAAWTLVMRLQFSLPLGARFLEKPINVSADPGYKVSTDPPRLLLPRPRLRVMGPRTLLQLLSGILVLTETRAGECGIGRERPLRGGARGPPGSLGGSNPGTERPRRPSPDPPPPRPGYLDSVEVCRT